VSTDELMKQLHDKATRGVALSPTEQTRLAAWYAQQDQEEEVLLTRVTPSPSLVALQAQVDSAVAQLLATTQRIQNLVTHNDSLRRDIATLQEQLTQSSSPQPA
jgi:peptidoglycan hydrolase CwlO-like protein